MRRRARLLILLTFFLSSVRSVAATEPTLSPAAVGWGNLLVPGLGATLRGDPGRGLIEAGAEIGLFFGGTFGVREGQFNIDTSIITPQRGNLYQPLIGQAMQEIGLKLHFFNSFYHYQQASLALADSEQEKSNSQPLYKGDWTDVLSAPFRTDNLFDPWVFVPILASIGYLAYDYHTTAVTQSTYVPKTGENVLYGFDNIGVIPLGSAFGEEVLFRGMIMREMNSYTGSPLAAAGIQSVMFAAIHPAEDRIAALAGGLYFAYLTRRNHGDLGKAIAMHFWFDVLSGVVDYLRFRAAHGDGAPWSPTLNLGVSVPLAH